MNAYLLSWGLSGLALMTLGFAGRAAPERSSMAAAHVRATDPQFTALLQEGRDRSITFRRLMQRIDETDGYVYVERGACSVSAAPTCLVLDVSDAAGARYLRIHVTRTIAPREKRITLIGHELQHADEILSRQWVRSAADAYALFTRIGSAESIRNFETPEAQHVEETIRRELRSSPRIECRTP